MQAPASHSQAADLLTIDEAATALRVSDATVFRLMRRGDLRVVRLGRRTLIERVELDRLIEERRSPTRDNLNRSLVTSK